MPPRAPHLQRGEEAERLAADHLVAGGLSLLERNYRCRYGEIDLIMTEGDGLVFVEVRFRHHVQFGGPQASVDHRKQQKLLHSAEHYLQQHHAHGRPCRFDVVAISGEGDGIKIEWLKNAFGIEW